MHRPFHRPLRAVSCFALAASIAFAAPQALAQETVATPAAASATPAGGVPAWNIPSADFQADPDVTFGVLPNGMRYAIKRNTNPIFEMPTEFLVTDRNKAVITVEILDDRDLRSDPVVAYVSIRLEDLLAAKEKQQDWFPLKNSKNGRVRMSAEWKPVQMSGSMNGSSGLRK